MNLGPWEKGMKDKAIEGPRIKRWKQWKIKPIDEKDSDQCLYQSLLRATATNSSPLDSLNSCSLESKFKVFA